MVVKKKGSSKNMKLVAGKDDDPEFPDSYEIVNEIKSPMSVLWYNLNFEFEDKYPAKMPPDFARDMIKMYSKKGDIVWDGFCGSGTVPIEAYKLGREGYGTDVNPKAIDLCHARCRDKFGFDFDAVKLHFKVADIRNIEVKKQPDLILTSSPFGLKIAGDKNTYSDEVKDLSHSKTMEEFFGKMVPAFQNYYNNLKPGGILIFDARDRTKGGYFDLGAIFRNICVDVGFQIVCRYSYFLMPWRMWTAKHKPTGFVIPIPGSVEAYVMYKPLDSKLD